MFSQLISKPVESVSNGYLTRTMPQALLVRLKEWKAVTKRKAWHRSNRTERVDVIIPKGTSLEASFGAHLGRCIDRLLK